MKTASKIYSNIQSGVCDVTNEVWHAVQIAVDNLYSVDSLCDVMLQAHGIKVGMTGSPSPGGFGNSNASQRGGCC